ncbi:MAG: peptidase domain protein [Myxococcales bacterium]|nr:peptidase domain protein [Myxococcales bacterium]
MSKSLWALAAVVLFSACNPAAPKFSFKHGERRGRLESNGLRFVLMPDPSTQLVEVDVHYEVGSREDPPGKAGIAHLVEHMMFQLKPDGETSPPLMQTIGDISTFFNAYTIWDMTHYMTTARAENLDALLKIEAMRLYYGCQTISNDEFLREREVVRNEIRQRGGTAEGQIPQLVLSSVYPQGHAYERMVGGDDSQLTTITLADTCKFIKDYYTPERATLIVAGGFDVDQTIASITKWFGKLEKRPSAPRAPVAKLELSKERKQFDLDVERPSVHIAFALPPQNTPEGEDVQFGINSAWARIASKGQEYDFAYSVDATVLGGPLAPIYLISIELKGMDKLNEALEFTQKATKQAYRGFDEGTFEQIEEWKNLRKAQFIGSLEELNARTNVVGGLVQFSDMDFDSQDTYIFHELDKIAKFDGERIGKAVKKWLDFDKARVVVMKPNKEGLKGDKRNTKVTFQVKSHESVVLPDVDPKEAKRPIRMSAELKSLVGATRFTLGNGMNVIMLPIKSMPLVSSRLIFNNVGESISPDNPVLAAAAANFLSLPIDADVFQRTGVNVGCSANEDSTVCFTSGINIYLGVMLKGFERLVAAGVYDQEDLERWQKSRREDLKTKNAQQQSEFQRQLLSALYGPDHPYTKTGVLTSDAIGKVSKDGLDSFRKTHYSAGNATLVVVGDFEPAAAEKMIRSTFSGWGKGTVDKAIDPTPFKRTGPAFVGVVGKEEPQLSVAIGYPAPAGVDGQQAARMVIAEMLNTRMGDVRFKLGSTYGVYAQRQSLKGPTAYQMGGTVDAPRAGESIKAMREGVDMLRKSSEQFDIDFVRARRKLLSSLLGESTVTGELAQRLGFMSTHNLPVTYYNTLLQQIAAVSPAQVHALIAKELDPNNEVIVILGAKPQLDKAFKDAGISDVKLVEPDYK